MRKAIRLVEYMRQYAASTRKSVSYKRQIRNTAKKIEEFEKYLGKELLTCDFDERMMEEFDYFLRNSPKNYKRSTIQSFGFKVAIFLRKAEKSEHKINPSFADYRYPQGEYYAVAFTEEEIETIYNLKGLSKSQKIARFWCVFSCWTAFRFSDLKRIEDINIESSKVILRTKKTNTEVKIPLHWMIKKLLKDMGGTLPLLRTQQNYSATIKRLCRKAKITNGVLIERHEGISFVRKRVPKWKMISPHTGRRSFATNAYFAGIPVARIMKLLGLKTQESFFKYLRIDEEENVRILQNHSFFVGFDKIHTFATTDALRIAEKSNAKLSKMLKKARLEKGISTKQLAEIAGCHSSLVERVEGALFSPSVGVITVLCAALEVSNKELSECLLQKK